MKNILFFNFQNLSSALCRFFQHFITITFPLTISLKILCQFRSFFQKIFCFISHPWKLLIATLVFLGIKFLKIFNKVWFKSATCSSIARFSKALFQLKLDIAFFNIFNIFPPVIRHFTDIYCWEGNTSVNLTINYIMTALTKS